LTVSILTLRPNASPGLHVQRIAWVLIPPDPIVESNPDLPAEQCQELDHH